MKLNLVILLLVCPVLIQPLFMVVSAGRFYNDFDITWGDRRAEMQEKGKLLTLSLDSISGSGFQSKKEFLFARIDMKIKLVSGDSAGTVTAYYLSSEGPNHDEIDFEFLGNVSGQPYTVHTNVYTQGKGSREQQFHLWFDPTKDFHTYSFLWNPSSIILEVDGIPIREFRNLEKYGVAFPNRQPMCLYSSIWNADQWATRGGLDKINWSKAPFTAYYRDFKLNQEGDDSTIYNSLKTQGLDANRRKQLRWVQNNHMIYNYCSDVKRFSKGRPRECRLTMSL